MDVKIESGWKKELAEEFDKPYFGQIVQFLKAEKEAGKTIYPPGQLIFNAFQHTHLDDVKVVILGQDPYHGPGQAHGLSFSVPDGMPAPPSLVNIFKELRADLDQPMQRTANLTHWADQGVLLLNAALTVRANDANSHSNIGWHQFTDAVIQKISDHKKHVVFMLWGSFAQGKTPLIDQQKHLILKAPHPSPLSAHRGFLGCKHFSKTNEWLKEHDIKPIDWEL